MNIRTAMKTAQEVKDGLPIGRADMQAAFDRLSEPDQLSHAASSMRTALWNTDQVELE